MSGYRGRTGPNFSEYLNSLNTLSSPYDDDQFVGEGLDLNQDLAMFTNTDFTHFDIPNMAEDGTFNFDLNNDKSDNSLKYEDLLSAVEPPQSFNTQTDAPPYLASYNTPIQPAPAPGLAVIETHPSPATTAPLVADRRNTDSAPSSSSSQNQPMNSEERSRLAAEEDKRRRNTAASARFRIKKKQREQALEKTVKEIQEKNSKLEAKLNQLETENKWLKDLITEKKGSQSKEEIAAAYQKFRKDSEERDLKAAEHTTGVGTE